MKESTAPRPSRGFTLIELLVVVAIVAVLAAILFPVFAQARLSAKTTSTSLTLQQMGRSALMYVNDYDQGIILACQDDQGCDRAWTITLKPYLKERQAYFDPSRPTNIQDEMILAPGVRQPWYLATTIAINNRGYTGVFPTQTGTCGGRQLKYRYGVRNLSTMVSPEQRVAFAPNAIYSPNSGFYFFNADQANLVNPRSALIDLNNQIYATRGNYKGQEIPVVHADGSLGRLRAGDFLDKTRATTASWCKWLNDGANRTWGSYWLPN